MLSTIFPKVPPNFWQNFTYILPNIFSNNTFWNLIKIILFNASISDPWQPDFYVYSCDLITVIFHLKGWIFCGKAANIGNPKIGASCSKFP